MWPHYLGVWGIRAMRISCWILGMPEAKKMTAKRATPPNMPARMPLVKG
jgi:hypothetical protein